MKNLSQSDVFRLEGNLLSADFIQDLSVLKTKYQSATDYNILPGLHVKEEIGRSWRISNAIWSKFQRKDKVGSATVQYWLQPLLNDALGFNDLTLVPEEALGNRSLPIHYQSGTTPILLLPHTFPLDQSDSQLSAEGRRKSPHSLLQESLNATREQSLWGFVSNGYFLRLLRQNPSLTRPAYIEIDLFRIFTEDRYADFFTCWLLLHRSRFSASPEAPHHSILEQWHQTSQETGERALENLREGVKNALKQLGNGFLTHSNNQELKNALRSGTLTTEAYFNQLLRLVYRLILLYTAEDRNLLHSPESTQEQRDIYAKSYSAEYLRGRALQRSHDSYSDLWQGLLITFYGLGAGAEPIGLPNLGGLFSENQCPDLDHAELGNRALLAAIRSTCFFHSGTTLTRINYRDRNTEELGSVYESLLELQPILRLDAHPPWRFLEDETEGSTKGSTKKLTGSYYTPKELVQELIHSALEPVIATALRLPAPRAAVLGIKVLDPASGSGNFLLAAARRIAHELVRIDADDNHPETQAFRIALRDVVSHCIYGVDANPLAVELCKTALWLETLEPGKPLGFLDHHIRHGNSLVGILHPEVMKNGIPEEAYSALSGDDPEICKQLKGSLRAQGRARQRKFSYTEVDAPYAKAYAVLEAMPEDTPGEVQAKSRTHSELETNLKNSQQRLCADLFCATFFIPKNRTYAERIPFSEDLRLVAEGATLRPGLAELAQKISSEHHFFHWPLVFPEVFSNGGFDVVLANPPWKRLKLQEQEFFGTRRPDIANAQNAAARSKMILALHSPEASPADHFLYQHFIHTKRSAEASSLFAHKSGRFPLTGIGDVNSYALFSETISQLAKEAGILVPSGIATDDSTKTFFGALTEDHRLVSLYDFENREKLFPAVHSRMKFCALTLGKETSAKFIFFATKVEQLQEEHRAFRLSREEIVLLNPNTHTCPVFRSQTDAELTKKIYQHVPVLLREKPVGNPWGISFLRMFDMSNDSHLFRTADQLTAESAKRNGSYWIDSEQQLWVPLYEAKMMHQFDHRWATYDGKGVRNLTETEKKDPNRFACPRYWILDSEKEAALKGKTHWKWLMGWRGICRSTDMRTVIASVIPRVGSGGMPIWFVDSKYSVRHSVVLLANFNSLALDYTARQKVGGTHMTLFIMKQLPILPPESYSPEELEYISSRVLELTYTAKDLAPFARDLGYEGPPFEWNEERRAWLRAELDACYAKKYGLTRDELRYVLDPTDVFGEEYPSETFRVLKKNEMEQFGEYRTRRLVLEAWDRSLKKF